MTILLLLLLFPLFLSVSSLASNITYYAHPMPTPKTTTVPAADTITITTSDSSLTHPFTAHVLIVEDVLLL